MKIIKKLGTIFLLIVTVNCNCHINDNTKSTYEIINNALNEAVDQSLKMAHLLADKSDRLPKTLNSAGELETCSPSWWVSGFYPGVLWYLYEYSKIDSLRYWAEEYSARIENQQYTTDNHDVGFIIFCSFGNGYRITGDTTYLRVIETAAKSLSTRYNPLIGCIRSWDYATWNKQWQYPVIIDNMMNLELLMWSAQKFSNSAFSNIAVNHANTTMKNHFRIDYSSFHVVSYDTITGQPELKHTAQGYSNESAWARGQAWGLYGYTMMYRMTHDTNYLKQARNIAGYIIKHPNLPADKIPYWDFNAPNIPEAKRDASAGAIICSALIELSTYVDAKDSAAYIQVAETQILTLSSPSYLAETGKNGGFILKHGVGHMPNGTEVDVPLTYADYYFVEALLRYKKRILKGL